MNYAKVAAYAASEAMFLQESCSAVAPLLAVDVLLVALRPACRRLLMLAFAPTLRQRFVISEMLGEMLFPLAF